jgi:hypothetical protein
MFFCSLSAHQAERMVSPCCAIKTPLLTTPLLINNTKKQSAKSNSTHIDYTLEKMSFRSSYVADASYNNIFATSGYPLIITDCDGYKKISPNCVLPIQRFGRRSRSRRKRCRSRRPRPSRHSPFVLHRRSSVHEPTVSRRHCTCAILPRF